MFKFGPLSGLGGLQYFQCGHNSDKSACSIANLLKFICLFYDFEKACILSVFGIKTKSVWFCLTVSIALPLKLQFICLPFWNTEIGWQALRLPVCNVEGFLSKQKSTFNVPSLVPKPF